jgi:hypothetical protein
MRKWIRSGWAMGVAVVFGLITASEGQAQFCAGYPTVGGQSSVGAHVSFPTGGTAYGVEGSYNLAGPIALFGSFNLRVPEEEGPNANIFGVGATYEIGNLLPVPGGLSICPAVGVGISANEGVTSFDTRLGVGFGTQFGAEGISVMPYVMPQFRLLRISGEGGANAGDDFGIEAGFLTQFGNLYAGVSLDRSFAAGADIFFGVRAGWVFGLPF